ncbi:hypothetical protein [Burkholderia sp. Ac-20365]|uniref:hypothetical protein n=1 Tax=Burkholderia sp. Ac-20365 TaxID=2703897 RepID=UPI00197B1744|nr:hypothetical protein [Burkholderia sp. Ac-20365]MBN3760370.1 hypothetical protein [Burkholderia sp. Ac-20365]
MKAKRGCPRKAKQTKPSVARQNAHHIPPSHITTYTRDAQKTPTNHFFRTVIATLYNERFCTVQRKFQPVLAYTFPRRDFTADPVPSCRSLSFH